MENNDKNSISAYMQVYSNKRAVYECLKEFRKHYKDVPITLISDNGEDFSNIAKVFNTKYFYSDKNILPKGMMNGIESVMEYLKRIYNHCISVDTDWVIILEEDVLTKRQIKFFPSTDAAGPRLNQYNPILTNYLTIEYGISEYGYGMCGGSIFKRKSFIDAYNRNNDISYYLTMDNRLDRWSDIPLTLLFHINGYTYSIWNEISETMHPDPSMRIYRDSAFDHAYKFWYGKIFSETMLDKIN